MLWNLSKKERLKTRMFNSKKKKTFYIDRFRDRDIFISKRDKSRAFVRELLAIPGESLFRDKKINYENEHEISSVR